MNIKDTLLNMSVWKAIACAFLLILGMGMMMEMILSHTVFHFMDRMILSMENDKKADIADLESMAQQEQTNFCDKYQLLQEEKANLAKRNATEFSYDFAYKIMNDHARDLEFAIQQHKFNLTQCQKTLQEKTI